MIFENLKKGLTRTRNKIGYALSRLGDSNSIEQALEELEELLFTSDLGLLSSVLMEKAEEQLKSGHIAQVRDLPDWLKGELTNILITPPQSILKEAESKPTVILVSGVNGAGKTTSIAKLCYWLNQKNKSVVVGACDTFRAAAVEQLEIWCERTNTICIKGENNSDPAAVAHNAAQTALALKKDFLILDTAGRLHTQKNLMQELEKISRVTSKIVENTPHHNLLVLDATTGQNAIQQAKLFSQTVPISGIVLSKLDGTAKGGAMLSINQELKIPVLFVGLGEGIDDFSIFDPKLFIDAIFEDAKS